MKKLMAISSVMLLLSACAHQTLTPPTAGATDWTCHNEDPTLALKCVPGTKGAKPEPHSRTPSGRAQLESNRRAR